MEKKKILLKGHVIYPEGLSEGKSLVGIEGQSIHFVGDTGSFSPQSQMITYDFGASYICPGFIDLHVHGTGGSDIMDGTYASLDNISRTLASGGTTSFLATTISAPKKELCEVIESIAVSSSKIKNGARIVGIHLEGPFLNPGRRGAHKEENLRIPDINELTDYIQTGGGMVKMLTIAPELPGALRVIEYAAAKGLLVSLGHSEASIVQLKEAYKAGLSHVTHAFNAMTPMHHRDPGTTGAILAEKGLTVDIIVDGQHVHPSVIKILLDVKGLEKVCVITDCTRAGQMGDGHYELGGQEIVVKQGTARLGTGNLAGSTINMAQTVKNLVEKVGLSLAEAVQLASVNPAKFMGLESKGWLEPGRDADIVVLDRNYKVLMTIVAGQVVYG